MCETYARVARAINQRNVTANVGVVDDAGLNLLCNALGTH